MATSASATLPPDTSLYTLGLDEVSLTLCTPFYLIVTGEGRKYVVPLDFLHTEGDELLFYTGKKAVLFSPQRIADFIREGRFYTGAKLTGRPLDAQRYTGPATVAWLRSFAPLYVQVHEYLYRRLTCTKEASAPQDDRRGVAVIEFLADDGDAAVYLDRALLHTLIQRGHVWTTSQLVMRTPVEYAVYRGSVERLKHEGLVYLKGPMEGWLKMAFQKLSPYGQYVFQSGNLTLSFFAHELESLIAKGDILSYQKSHALNSIGRDSYASFMTQANAERDAELANKITQARAPFERTYLEDRPRYEPNYTYTTVPIRDDEAEFAKELSANVQQARSMVVTDDLVEHAPPVSDKAIARQRELLEQLRGYRERRRELAEAVFQETDPERKEDLREQIADTQIPVSELITELGDLPLPNRYDDVNKATALVLTDNPKLQRVITAAINFEPDDGTGRGGRRYRK